MIIEIKVPSPGESITEAEMTKWFVANGDSVEKDQEIGEVESEKATLPLVSPESGKITIAVASGKVQIGAVVATVDTSAADGKVKKAETAKAAPAKSEQAKAPASTEKPSISEKTETAKAAVPEAKDSGPGNVKVSPVAQKMMDEQGLSVDDIIQGLKRIGKKEVETVVNMHAELRSPVSREVSRETDKAPMSNLRKKLSQRLVAVKNETAMLTTFNEADMSAVMEWRKKYQDAFVKQHGIKLGFMSFFVKAASEALQLHPMVNSMIDGDQVIAPRYTDISIAVQGDKGLVVPVLKNVEAMSFADIEKKIAELADKARSNRLSMEEMAGGTFTITNGGVFGSLMSTPILNPPQSAILGMHKIMDRPMAVDGKVEIRPMMYLALSYDHRIVDGKDSVGFLVKIKDFIEHPELMLFGGKNPEKILLGL